MTTPNGERRSPEPTSAELARLRAIRESIAEELPDLVARDQLRRTAREERSISGAVRDAIHRSELPLHTIAAKAGLSPVELVHGEGRGCEVEFMTLDGETIAVSTLRADQVRQAHSDEIAHARPIGAGREGEPTFGV